MGSESFSISSSLTAEWPVTNKSTFNYLLFIHWKWDKKYRVPQIDFWKTVCALWLSPADGIHWFCIPTRQLLLLSHLQNSPEHNWDQKKSPNILYIHHEQCNTHNSTQKRVYLSIQCHTAPSQIWHSPKTPPAFPYLLLKALQNFYQFSKTLKNVHWELWLLIFNRTKQSTANKD